ncbi:MAG: hypothetical protein B0D92_04475 [Spirochaeta sp. LUC14_002_19_P3]|nr:MAG: hypothetical protein B0D92_04475 [Spirochaeta sp. LUC14_002_19_P3]
MSIELIIFLIIVNCGLFGFIIFFFLDSILTPKRAEVIQELIQQGKLTLAIQTAKKMIARNSRNCDAYYLLGKAYQLEGKNELALMAFKTVNKISIFSNICQETVFRRELAALYLQFGEEQEALKEFILLINLEPYNAMHYYQIGKIYDALYNREKAAIYYKKAIDRNIKLSEAYSAYGRIMYETQLFPDAKKALSKAIRLAPDNGLAHLYLGRIYADNNEYHKAFQEFSISQKDPKLKLASLIEIGICHLAIDKIEDAQESLEKALNTADENFDPDEILYARYYLAVCYEKSRKLDEAIQLWEAIDMQRKNFRDVPKKLQLYQVVGTNDLIKEFLTMPDEQFEKICRQILKIQKYKALDMEVLPQGFLFTVEEHSRKNDHLLRKRPRLFKILRILDDIDLEQVRGFHKQLIMKNIRNGCMLTCGQFTRSAREFSKTHPIELLDKDNLLDILQTIDASRAKE